MNSPTSVGQNPPKQPINAGLSAKSLPVQGALLGLFDGTHFHPQLLQSWEQLMIWLVVGPPTPLKNMMEFVTWG